MKTKLKNYWTVDDFLDPRPDSKLVPFSMLTTALDDAQTRSSRKYNTIIGLWDQDDQLHCIFINGERFNPA
jgi:hypothetical protein